jgi:hypothetical protein
MTIMQLLPFAQASAAQITAALRPILPMLCHVAFGLAACVAGLAFGSAVALFVIFNLSR